MPDATQKRIAELPRDEYCRGVARRQCRLASCTIEVHTLAGVGSALYDLTNPAYAPECWITLITKGVMGLVAGLAMADREEPKYGRCTVSAALGCVAYYILYFFKSFAYDGLLMGGLTASVAAAALPLKIPASLFNGAVAIILAPPLCVALRRSLKRTHIQLP